MKTPYSTCKLFNGGVHEYHAACQPGKGQCYGSRAFMYLGEGRIHAIHNYTYQGGPILEFYVLRANRPRRMR